MMTALSSLSHAADTCAILLLASLWFFIQVNIFLVLVRHPGVTNVFFY